MNFYWQKNPLWKDKTLGNTPYKMNDFGCLVCSISMVLGKTPDDILAHKELFDSEGVIKSYQQVADTFGSSILSETPDPVIIRTLFDGSLHFVVRYQGKIYDPLSPNGTPLRNYKITSYVKLKPLVGESGDMIAQNDLDGRVFTYNGMGLLWVKGEWIGKDENDKSKVLPNTWAVSLKPLPVEKEIVTIVKEVPVTIEVDKLTPEEVKQVEDDYIKNHPPVVEKEYISEPMTVGLALVYLWNAIKNIKIGGKND